MNPPPPKKRTARPVISNPVAADAVRDWESVQAQLAPIIGESGFRVLFARSLHRARLEHPWLARDAAPEESPFATLKTSLDSQPRERAALGSQALSDHFNNLLAALIGEDLMTRLLGSS